MCNIPVFKVGNRDLSIDILRAIALLGIMLVHVKPWLWLEQLRDFDVPLMVFLSAMVYKPVTCDGVGYWLYCKKRFIRLIVPTWIFLIILVLLSIVTGKPIRPQTMLELFTLQTQWYVWIIRVLFLLAIVAPLTLPIVDKKFSVSRFFAIGALTLFALELLPHSPDNLPLYYLMEFIPFFLFYAFGYEVYHFSKTELVGLSLIMGIVYICYAIYYFREIGQMVTTQVDKYPPHLYYTSYSFAAISLLWLIREKLVYVCNTMRLMSIIRFIGAHTLWIYLWHIAILHIMFHITDNFLVKFIIVGGGACIVTLIQCKIVDLLIRKTQNETIKKNLSLLFLG